MRAVSGPGDRVLAEHPVEPSQRGTLIALVRSVWRSLLVPTTEPTRVRYRIGLLVGCHSMYLTEINGRSKAHLRETSGEQRAGPFQALSKCLRSHATDGSGLDWPETLDPDEQQDLTEGNGMLASAASIRRSSSLPTA